MMKRLFYSLILILSSQASAQSQNAPAEIWEDGTQFIGELINGKREGGGTIIWSNGTKFVGNFENGLREGEGRLILPDGSRYVAVYENDVIVGDSVAQELNGDNGVPQVAIFLQEMNRQIEAEVRSELIRWKNAWSSQNLTAYLSHYSTDFKPVDASTVNTWRQNRAVRIRRPDTIEIELLDLAIVVETETRAVATFLQQYQSNLYQDQMNKQMTLQRELGGWKIIAERPVQR